MSDGSLTVSDYSKRFLDKYLASIDEDAKGKNEVAGAAFTNLLKKLFEAGSTKDVQIPLRVLRDEIGRIYFGSTQQRQLKIEHLFMLYDSLEKAAQEEARSKSAKEAAWALTVLEELRQRFSRLVIGDTWQAWPELQLKALKRMYTYASQEKATDKQAPAQPATPTSGRLGKKLSRSFSSSSAQTTGSWQSTFDDLAKSPGARLLPLIKLMLAEDTKGPSDLPGPPTPADSPGTNAKGGLQPAPSGILETGAVTKMSELDMMDMDDLLGLNDPPAKETAADPFQAKAPTNGASLPKISGPPQPQQQPPQQQGFSTSPRGENFNTANFGAGQPVPQHHNGQQNSFVSRHSGSLSRGTSFDGRPPLASTNSGHLSTGPRLSSSGLGVITIPKGLNSIGTSASPAGSFNPFDLPSPTYASPVPSHADNSFAEFSPVAGAPVQPKVLNPMRAPPEPPISEQARGGHLQPPKSSFSSW